MPILAYSGEIKNAVLMIHGEKAHSKYFSELETPELDVSYAQAYSDMFPKLILQEGNLVVQIEFYQTSEAYELPLSEWAQRMAESLF